MGKAEKTRQFIIEQVAPIFNKKGYAGTSLSDLTEATGLTKGSIYGNFHDKEEVAIASFDYNLQNLNSTMWQGVPYETHSADKLLKFLENARTNAQAVFDNGGCPILNTATESDDGNLKLKGKAINALERWKTKLMEVIQEGIIKEELKPINAEQFAVKIVTVVEGTNVLAKTTGNHKYLHYNVDGLIEDIRNIIR